MHHQILPLISSALWGDVQEGLSLLEALIDDVESYPMFLDCLG